jgi:hypothetical protein
MDFRRGFLPLPPQFAQKDNHQHGRRDVPDHQPKSNCAQRWERRRPATLLDPAGSSERRPKEVEKSHEGVRLEKIESTIASDLACDQRMSGLRLPLILPDPELYSGYWTHPRSFPDFIPACCVCRLSRSIGRIGSRMTSTTSQIRTLHNPCATRPRSRQSFRPGGDPSGGRSV